jgi:PAS domain S-box-containing protein
MINDLLKKHPATLQGLLGLVLLLFFSGSVAVYLSQHHKSLMTTTLTNHSEEQLRVWGAVLQGYNNGMEAYFNSIVMQKPVLELLHQAYEGDDNSMATARVNLFRLLYEPYRELQEKGVRQLHFHTPESASFLRMHYPQSFGDSLKDVRPTVVEANRTLTPVVGFEGGRVVSGFRNVFPIVDNGRHLGSVELSQAFETLRSNIDHLYPDSAFILILKDTELDKLFDEQRPLYSRSLIDQGWLVEDPKGDLSDGARPLSDDATAIIPQLKTIPGFSTALNKGTAASFVVPHHCCHFLVTTTPIFDIHANLAATLISFHASDQIAKIYRHLYFDIIVALTFSVLLALTLVLILNRMNKVQSQRREIAAIAESLHSGLFVINSYGKTLFANRRASELLGYSPAELLGASAHELFHVHPGPVTDCPIVKVGEHGNKYHAEEIFKRKDGCEFPVDVGAVPAEITPGEISVVVVFDDISDRKKLEAQYLQAQKMESVGILAGGIAHDFNNILSAITGFSHLALRKMPPQDPLRKHIDQIVDASQRATALTRELLLFSRKQPGDYTPIDLNSVLYQVEPFLLRTLGAEIGLGVTPAQEILPIHGDAQQLQQVIINLAINARDAMPQGGTLRIDSKAIELPQPLDSYRETIPPGSYALLSVSDEGSGIEAEALEHIFDPFFTTKGVGKGTGLGLAVAYGIIQQHKGFIRVESTPDTGSCFFIYLPLTNDIVCVDTQQSSAEHSYQGTETILLAEDEPHVRAVLTEILESAGYQVLSAADGAEAVRRFQEHQDQDQIQLLLFDIMMPHLNGKEAADRIRRQRPDLPLLYLSGYAPDSLQQRIAADLDSTCLLKPVEPQELLAAIRDILNQ